MVQTYRVQMIIGSMKLTAITEEYTFIEYRRNLVGQMGVGVHAIACMWWSEDLHYLVCIFYQVGSMNSTHSGCLAWWQALQLLSDIMTRIYAFLKWQSRSVPNGLLDWACVCVEEMCHCLIKKDSMCRHLRFSVSQFCNCKQYSVEHIWAYMFILGLKS